MSVGAVSRDRAAFAGLPAIGRDQLWIRADEYASDARKERLDLIVGVYRDDEGRAPVMGAVRDAEARLLKQAASKQYVGPMGDRGFNSAVTDLVLGSALARRATTIQTVAGTGALRLLFDFWRVVKPEATVHVGTPAYINHPAILRASGLATKTYNLRRGGRLDVDAVLAAAGGAAPGDVLLLQGCCHNPTGLSMPTAAWTEIGEVIGERGVVPLIDHAYFGLGDGLEDDLGGARQLLERVPLGLVAVSASKIWSLYSERTGCAMVVSCHPEDGTYAHDLLESTARATYSQPPAHGASIVREILHDDELRIDWLRELEAMRMRLDRHRQLLLAGLTLPDQELEAVSAQRGMFLSLPLGPEQMRRLSKDHAIYGALSGRINLAAIPADRLEDVSQAISRVALTAG